MSQNSLTLKISINISLFFLFFLAISELPCETDGFAGNYDDDQTTPCNNEGMVFCYQNCSDLLWEKNVPVIEKNVWNSRLKAKNSQIFEKTRTITSNSERSEKFLVTEWFFNLFLEVSDF